MPMSSSSERDLVAAGWRDCSRWTAFGVSCSSATPVRASSSASRCCPKASGFIEKVGRYGIGALEEFKDEDPARYNKLLYLMGRQLYSQASFQPSKASSSGASRRFGCTCICRGSSTPRESHPGGLQYK